MKTDTLTNNLIVKEGFEVYIPSEDDKENFKLKKPFLFNLSGNTLYDETNYNIIAVLASKNEYGSLIKFQHRFHSHDRCILVTKDENESDEFVKINFDEYKPRHHPIYDEAYYYKKEIKDNLIQKAKENIKVLFEKAEQSGNKAKISVELPKVPYSEKSALWNEFVELGQKHAYDFIIISSAQYNDGNPMGAVICSKEELSQEIIRLTGHELTWFALIPLKSLHNFTGVVEIKHKDFAEEIIK